MKEIKKIEPLEEFAGFIKYELQKYNKNYAMFVESNDTDNLKMHEEIIKYLSSKFKSSEECLKFFLTINLDEYFRDKSYLNIDNGANVYDIKNIMITYINIFINEGYLKFKNGKIIPNPNINMNVDGDRSYYSDKYAQNHYGNLPCFILTNGECYFALGMHNTLAKWLHVNGINISKALRFDQFNRNYEISIGKSDAYNQLDNHQLYLLITDEQANTFAKLYKSVRDLKNLEEIEFVILDSHGLGFDKNAINSKEAKFARRKNLLKLCDAFKNSYRIDENYINSRFVSDRFL